MSNLAVTMSQEVSSRTTSGRSDGSSTGTARNGMTALRFGGVPGVAVLGGGLSQLRRRGEWWRLRDWRLGTKLTAVLLVPLLLAGVLGALRVADSLREADHREAVARQVALAQLVGVTVHDLQRERQLVPAEVITPDTVDRTALPAQAQRVDVAITALQSSAAEVADLGPAAAAAHRAALARLAEIPVLRQEVFSSPADVVGIVARYTDTIAVLLELHRAMLGGTSDPLREPTEGMVALASAKEQLSVQHAVLLAAMLSGDHSPEQQAVLRTADVRFDVAIEVFGQFVTPEQRQRYGATVTGDVVSARQRLLDDELSGTPQNVPADWDAAATETTERVREVETALLDWLLADTAALGERARYAAIRDAAVVTAVLLLAVALLVVVVRSLLRPLRALRTHAFSVADRRLPDAVEQLRCAEDKIGETTVEPVPVYSREEVGQVARAFDAVHVQAVRLAAEQAMLRSTINDIFLNLAGRSQELVEQQLKLIDKLESGEQDPEQLSNLFQLDHLATRMRRNGENLLVLAGGDLHRDAASETSVLDMLRAAVSEVAEYSRVTLRRPPAATVSGPVAGDLAHLIAELLDNATGASPPDTSVSVRSTIAEDGGLLVEITDCGTGLPPGELHAINERLAAPPAFNVPVSRQMGLFVVGRLAARHHIRVRLRQQRGDFGITAAVLLPPSLVSVDSGASLDQADDPADHAASGTTWSEKTTEVPLQVCMVDGAEEEDPLSPSSIGNLMTVRFRRPRTAEDEWFELFGHPEPEQDHNPEEADELLHEQDPVPPHDSAAAPEVSPETHEEIFEEVSAWFQKQCSAPAGQAAPDDQEDETPPRTGLPPPAVPTTVAWRSSGDEGWQAAEVLRSRVDFEFTTAGLPQRLPRAQLLPGSAIPSEPEPPSGSNGLSARTAEEVRRRLSRYQRGLRHGRHARLGTDDLPTRTHARQIHPEEDSP
ncbi:MAG: nitrate- and nitrite sensing domain-containing protein [Pseudonocardiaceae bacterium]